ncbi:MAG: hypothetical protein ABL999_19540 [Pyrinomonadaceae bacterium]
MKRKHTKRERTRDRDNKIPKTESNRTPEVYFAHSYGGFYPMIGYWSANTSRFERGFNHDLLGDHTRGRSWWRKAYDEIAHWFGSKDAAERRQMDKRGRTIEKQSQKKIKEQPALE